MKILIVSQFYGLINGASICTYELVSQWSSCVEKIEIVCSEKWYRSSNESQGENIFIHPLKNFNLLTVRSKVKKLVDRDTIVYGADDYGCFGKIQGVPYVLTYHGNWPQALTIGPSFFFKGLLHIFLYIVNFWLANTVVVPNYFHLPWIARFNSQVIMIRNGIRLQFNYTRPQLKHPCAIVVGRMDERKGKLLVDVIRALNTSNKQQDWYLYIVGSISYQPLQNLVDDRRIFDVGFIDNVADYLQAADVFILASAMDLVSLAVTEAMALAKPVVCFDVGALSEVVNESTGALIPAFDCEKFANATLDLLFDREKLNRQGKNAKETVKDFSWEKSALEYLKVFQQLLKD